MGKLRNLTPRVKTLGHGIGWLPREEARRKHDRDRARRQDWRAWYKSPRWAALRLQVLARDEYRCQRTGVLLGGRANAPDSPVVHHKTPHRGDPALFWDIANLEAVSKAWHDSEGQREDLAGG